MSKLASSSLRRRVKMDIRIRCALILCLAVALVPRVPAQGSPEQNAIHAISDALRSRDLPLAQHLCQDALVKAPGDYRLWTLCGMAAAGMGDLPKALLDYRHALNLSPAYLPALEGAAQTEFQLGKDGAIPLLEKILVQRPDDPTTHALLAVLQYRKQDCADAVGHFEKASAVIANQPAALNGYGLCLSALHRDEDAAGIFAQALGLDPSRPEARYNLALAQWNAQHADDALKTLEPLISAAPTNPDALSLAADIYESKNDTASAVALLRKALEADPKDTAIYLQFAALSFDHASPQVGIDMLNLGLTQLPREPRLNLVRGILLTQVGEFAKAADDFDAASRLDPRLQFLGVAQGLVRSQQHNTPEALASFRAAVKAHPNEALAHYLLAEALLEGDTQQGSPAYKEELQAATRAVELDPKLVAAQDLLATIYIEDGNTEQAIRHSRAALVVDPNDQQAVYHLIVALRKTGDKDEIPALLKRLVDLRAKSKSEDRSAKRYQLYEEQPSSGSAPQ
jgi:tetratricopeptide (TPR) repeat protein